VLFAWLEPLVAADTDSSIDIYERAGGITTMESVGSGGQNGSAHAFFAGASEDASRVFFTSTDQLNPGDGDSAADVHERVFGTTALFASGPAPAALAGLSADGTHAVLRTADPLLAADGDTSADHYLFRAPTGYARPKSADVIWASLVPAYEPCTSANRTHGPPLAFGSCAPPQRSAPQLTLGTPDANRQPPGSAGSVRVRAVAGSPSTPGDQADARIVLDITDVRVAAGLTDYTGQLEVRLGLRITDKLGGVSATVQDTTLSAPAQCAQTADPEIGGWCSLVTSADALAPGTVSEGKRTVWELDSVKVHHDGTPFATQGLFIP
jgi:hypothetical protein